MYYYDFIIFYSVSFTAAATGCHATATFSISSRNSTLAASASFSESLCYGGLTTAAVAASGGTGTITYAISSGAGYSATNTTGIFTSLPAGSYNVLEIASTGLRTCPYSAMALP